MESPLRRQVAVGLGVTTLLACAGQPVSAPAPVEHRTPSGLAFDVQGHGPPVVLIHGAFLDRRQWTPQLPLAGRFTVIRYDTRWHGRSAGAVTSFTTVADLIEVLDAAGIRRTSVVGLSHGAEIAVDFALAHPERLGRLVLVSPGLGGYQPVDRPAFWTPLLAALARNDAESAAEILAASPIMAVGPADSGWVRAMVREQASVFRQDARLQRPATPAALGRLHQIVAPTLIIVGENDLRDTHHTADTLVHRIAGARRVSLPGAPHLVNITSAPAFNRLVGAFLLGETPR